MPCINAPRAARHAQYRSWFWSSCYFVAACSRIEQRRREARRAERAVRGVVPGGALAHPERATAIGDYRYNDHLDDYSPAAYPAPACSATRSFLARLNAISTAGFAGTGQRFARGFAACAHAAHRKFQIQGIRDAGESDGRAAVAPRRSAAVPLRSIPSSTTRTTSRACIRFRACSPRPRRCCAQVSTDKLMPVRFLLEKIPAQCDGVIAADPFLLPTKKFPGGHFRGGPAAPDQGDQRCGRQRRDSGVQGIRRNSSPRSTRRRGAPP